MLRPYALRFVFLAGLGFATTAQAAGIPAFDWNGLYFGGNGGTASGRLVTTQSSLTTDGTVFGFSGLVDTYLDPDDDKPFNGGFGGVQVGYNKQSGMLILGTEADFQFSRIYRSDADPVVSPTPLVETSADLQWFGTLRGRLGIAVDRLNVYGTGGLAYGHARGEITVTGDAGSGTPFTASDSQMQYGYTLGGGIEAAITDHWIVRGEYLYINLGTKQYDFAFPASNNSTATSRETITENLFRAAVSYKF